MMRLDMFANCDLTQVSGVARAMKTTAKSAPAPGAGQSTRGLDGMREGDPEVAEEVLSRFRRELRTLAPCKPTASVPSS